ncbi:MAG: sigma-70 family RNA polymerase sigma factor [Planctomycetes bacterium]|nr:sigma-70 family RNA polymerase sigma factor [Planctomycetota bacterium]
MTEDSTIDLERDLCRRLRAGDRTAGGELVDRHLQPLYEFVHFRVGGDRALAEDVVQETFVVALESLDTFDGRSSLHGWLCGVAKNKIRSLRRKRRPTPLADVLDESDAEIDAILAKVESEDLPESVLEARETRDLVGAALASLPLDYRAALVGKYVDGKSTAELAAASGKGVKAAESLLHRSREAFARVFELLAKRRGGVA